MKNLFTVIACFLVCNSFGQIELDLSKKITSTQSINPQNIKIIKLKNALPIANDYKIDIIVKHNFQGPLTFPTQGSGGAAGVIPGSCQTMKALVDALDAETEESKIPLHKENIQNAIKALLPGDLLTCKSFIDEANHEIEATTIDIPVDITIGKNDELDITITRDNNKWSYVYKNDQPSHWTTYYGFTYIPDVFTKFKNYYANQQDDGAYIISKLNSSNKNVFQNVSPTAMFTYRFFDKKPDAIAKFGLTAGIFYNTEILGAMFGPSLVIGDAATLNTGISFVQKYQLKGQYKEGQVIKDNLDFDQLHNKIWTYDMFISIGLNIPELFGKKKESSSGDSSNK